MNFFERQDLRRRKTRFLVVLFILTIICIILAVYLATIGCLYLFEHQGADGSEYIAAHPFQFWQRDIFINVVASVTAIILFGTLIKIFALRQGGKAVAEMLGGKLIQPNTIDPDERKVLNVVEEMAIASGTSVPPVYLLHLELGINAFAAGFSTQDAVIGVTWGAMKLLSRDELQGVIAHEFSHVLNGDMRMNLRMMGVLNGILIVAIIGRVILESFTRGRVGSSRGRSKVPVFLLFLGFALWAIGYIGILFARIIKSAVSRERECLADASSVQFTRNPSGIAGALKKIGGLEDGSRIAHPKGEEASHFYFAKGLTGFVSSLFSTHPSLEGRIRELEPGFDGKYPKVEYKDVVQPYEPPRSQPPKKPGVKRGDAVAPVLSAMELVAKVGELHPNNLAYATSILEDLPSAIREEAQDPLGARAILFSLLLDRQPSMMKQAQQQYLFLHGNYNVYQRLLRICEQVQQLEVRFRLPLVDLCLASLTTLSQAQYQMMKENIQKLILADGKVYPFELVMKVVVFHHLDPRYGIKKTTKSAAKSLDQCAGDLISMLANVGDPDKNLRDQAFQKAVQLWNPASSIGLTGQDDLKPDSLEISLSVMSTQDYKVKEKILSACAVAVLSDRKVGIEEIEMIRAFADALDCPVPPLSA